MSAPTTADDAIRTAAANLGRARRHAVWLERLAISILTFGVALAVLAVAVEPTLLWVGAALALAAAATWGVLRGLALLLHLRVDAVMIELDGDRAEDDRTEDGPSGQPPADHRATTSDPS